MVTSQSPTWVLLTYRIAREPSAGRVAIWRKLKRLGAILVHDSVWVLPASRRTAEQFQWLASEIHELGGDAWFWRASLSPDDREQTLVALFQEQADAAYAEILTALDSAAPDLAALSRRYQQIRAVDYFDSLLGAQVRARLLRSSPEVKS